MTLRTVIGEVCAFVGVRPPASTVILQPQQDRTMWEMVNLANEMAQRIAYNTRDWTLLIRTATFTGPGWGMWGTGTSYAVGTKVTDPANGASWQAAIAHTSGTGTFADDRTANPKWWTSVGQAAFPLPANYKRMLLNSNVRSSAQPLQPLSFISDFDDWTELRLSNRTSSSWGEWTMAGGQFLVAPPPRGPVIAVPPNPDKDLPAETISWPYLDKNCITLGPPNTGVLSDRFAGDDDMFNLNERLLKLGMIWQWKAYKGGTYAEDIANYEDDLSMIAGADKPSPIMVGRMNLSTARQSYPYSTPTAPETPYP